MSVFFITNLINFERLYLIIYFNSEGKVFEMKNNPIIWSDYPDLDVIRVGDTYYMVSTTMHLMPGCVILRSYDLINWEVATLSLIHI